MKKKILALALAGAMSAGLLAGCGGGGNAANSDNDNSNNASSGKADTLTVALPASPSKLDPIHYTGAYEGKIIDQVCDRLIEFNDAEDTLVPSLATDWTVSDDGLTYVFQIREGVHFQDGTYSEGREMTAEDVAWSLNRSAQYSDNQRLAMLNNATVTGDWEVTCTLKSANAAFLTALTDAGNSILAKEEVEGWGDNFGYNLTGTGAFKLDKFVLDEYADLSANENYWMGTPNLKNLTFRFINDSTQTANALLTGDIDLATQLTGEAINTISNAGNGVNMMKVEAMQINYVRFNMKNGPTADPLVRQALIQAVNQEEMLGALYQYDEVKAACLPLPYGSWGYDSQWEELALDYDVEAAKEKMAQAGYADGVDINIYVSNSQERQALCTFLQAYWAQIGVNLKINVNEWGTFSDMAASGNADIYAMSWTWYPDPYFFLNNLFCSDNITSNGNGALYINDEVDELLQKAIETTDIDERAGYYSQVIKHAMEDYTGIYYANPYTCYGINERVQDFTPRADGNLRFVVWDGEKIVRNTSVA